MRERESSKKNPRFAKTLTEEILDLDHRLVTMLAKRTELLTRAAQARKAKGKALADPFQEKKFRQAWERLVSRYGLSARLTRQLFDMINGLAYTQAGMTNPQANRHLTLYPATQPLAMTLTGPTDQRTTRLLTALMASADQQGTLSPVLLNDPLLVLLKALNKACSQTPNQTESVLSWHDKGIEKKSTATPVFHGKTFFAGEDALNFFLLAALALPHTGYWTLTGGTSLKLFDTRIIRPVFASLGARITSIEPHSNGLPIRMESAGLLSNTAHLPADFPADAAVALLIAAHTYTAYPEGFTLHWEAGWQGAPAVTHTITLLTQCGISCSAHENSCTVFPHAPAASPSLSLEIPNSLLALDPVLCGYLLAMPCFCARSGQSAAHTVCLKGRWPANTVPAQTLENLLTASGLVLDITQDHITAASGPWPETIEYTIHDCMELAPLALALGIHAPSDARIQIQETALDVPAALALAEHAGRLARIKSDRVVIVRPTSSGVQDRPEEQNRQKGKKIHQQPFAASDHRWAMAFALLATGSKAHSILANPGVVSSLWPAYWQLFFAHTQARQHDTAPADKQVPSKGRRIKLE